MPRLLAALLLWSGFQTATRCWQQKTCLPPDLEEMALQAHRICRLERQRAGADRRGPSPGMRRANEAHAAGDHDGAMSWLMEAEKDLHLALSISKVVHIWYVRLNRVRVAMRRPQEAAWSTAYGPADRF